MNLLEEIRAFRELVLRKQDRLTPGDYITIENDVISADLSRVDDVENDIRDLKTGYAAVIAKNLQQDTTLANHETRLIDAEGDIDDLESGLSDLEEKVDNIHGFDIVPLGEGDYDPETGIPTIENPKANTLYLVPNLAEEDQKNLWIEWLWIQSKWEQFGAASIDMNNYVKKTDYATTTKTGVVKIKQLGGLTIGSNGDLSVSPATVGDISTYTSNPLPITPSTAPDAVYYGLGRISRSGYTYSEQEKINIRQMLGATGVVADVRLDGASVLDSYGVARIPLATAGQKGVVRGLSTEADLQQYGVTIQPTGYIEVVEADHRNIKASDRWTKAVITPANQNEAVFYGLAKAAGDTTQQGAPDSEFPVGTYTPPAITAIQRMIGIGPATDETAGLVKASNIGGIDVDSSGSLGLYPATQANITGRSFGQRPITPENFDFAVKAALTDGIGAEWTAAEKAAARERIGAGQGGGGVTDVTVDNVSVVDPETGIAAIDTSDFGKVKDVTIKGTTIVDETTGVADLPIAHNKLGLVYVNTNDTSPGVTINQTSGRLELVAATTDNIDQRYAYSKRPITPTNFDYAVKAALTDGVGPVYTTEEQSAARTRLGIDYPVKDIQINTTNRSVLSDGVMSFHGSSFATNGFGSVFIPNTSETSVKKGNASYIPITVSQTHSAAFYGLAKAAGDTTMASSSNPVGTYTDEAKTAIKNMLGITQGEEGGVSVTLDDDGDIKIHGLGGQGGGGAVNDVQINGTTIVDSETGVAEIPANTSGTPGLWSIDTNGTSGGLTYHPVHNKLEVVNAGSTALLNRWHMKFVEAEVIDLATKAAMSAPIAATAGMKDGEYHYPAWTQQEQVRARERLGIGDWELIKEITLEEDTSSNSLYIDLDGIELDSIMIDSYPFTITSQDRVLLGFNTSNWFNYVGNIHDVFPANVRTYGLHIIGEKYGNVRRFSSGSGNLNWINSLNTRIYPLSFGRSVHWQDNVITSIQFRTETTASRFASGTNIKIYGIRSASSQPSGFKYTDAYINSLIDQKLSGLSVEGVGF